MALYELRTYTLLVGKMQEAIGHYQTLGWPALEKFQDNLVGYFVGDVGAMNQIIHIWRYEDDNERRSLWAKIYADPDFKNFVQVFRPLLLSQENKLMFNAPWGKAP